MSADNFYLIRKHPLGGFAAVMGFASSDDDHDWVAEEDDPQFDGITSAIEWASDQGSEYGVSVHPEIGEMGRRVLTHYMTDDDPAPTQTSAVRDHRIPKNVALEAISDDLDRIANRMDEKGHLTWDNILVHSSEHTDELRHIAYVLRLMAGNEQ